MKQKIQIQINGEKKQVSIPLSLKELLQEYPLLGGHLAIALNNEILPQSVLEEKWLQEGDSIEVVRAVAGG